MLAAVACTIRPNDDPHDLTRRFVLVFIVNEHYSLDAVDRFIRDNAHVFGPHSKARRELGRCKNLKRLALWADRKRRSNAMLGWTVVGSFNGEQ